MAQISQTQLRIEKIYDCLENLLIEIDENISIESIKKAYRELAKKYHPDVYKNDDASQVFDIIQKSYDYLQSEYDFIEKNASLIIKYSKFINDEAKSEYQSKAEERKEELNKLLKIKVSGGKNLENKILNWLNLEKKWLDEDKTEFNMYLSIVKNELGEVVKKLNDDINFLNDQIEVNFNNPIKQQELKELKKIKESVLEKTLSVVKEQVVIKTKEFEVIEQKIRELSFICSGMSVDDDAIFNKFYEYFQSFKDDASSILLTCEKDHNAQFVSLVSDEKLLVKQSR